MISLRYHIITIVAVFLALAVGTLVGGAFVQPVLQRQLEDRTRELSAALDERRQEIDELRAQLEALNAFAGGAAPYLTANRLLGEQVVVVAQEGIEDGLIGQTQRSLVDAGANLVAVVSARRQLASEDPDTRSRLAEALGSFGSAGDDLAPLAATRLAERLANGSGGASAEEDVLARLLSEGFLAPIGSGLSEGTLEQVGTDGQIVVVLAGGPDEAPMLPLDVFTLPLVRRLAELGVPVAAGESSTTVVPFVAEVRGSGNGALVTVDDLDLVAGGAALVLGLDRLLLTGEGGAYGTKDGADPLPRLP
ncbi:MAG TPA: copper transporter [Actinomycetota bacterium]|nr:copper transporter [Actinomycetota bacterium]